MTKRKKQKSRHFELKKQVATKRKKIGETLTSCLDVFFVWVSMRNGNENSDVRDVTCRVMQSPASRRVSRDRMTSSAKEQRP